MANIAGSMFLLGCLTGACAVALFMLLVWARR